MASHDFVPAATGTYSVLRPRDLVSFTVRAIGLQQRVAASGLAEWVAADGEGRLIVDLPPQHIAETVLASGSTSAEGRLAGPSSLHFTVPRDHVVPLSVDGVLTAMNELPLVVAPRTQGQASTLELPWRLLLALGAGARCRHRNAPLSSVDGTVQMWHTRVVGPSASGYCEVFPFASLPLDTAFAAKTPLRDKVAAIAQQGADNPAKAMSVDKLILTACGAWFSGSVIYPQLEWTHRSAMGRDFYVRLADHGVLFPFGHQASVVMVAERQFDTGTKVAGLHQTFALIITQPVVDYKYEAEHEREFPFQRVDIEPVQVIPLDDPGGAGSFWPRVGGVPVMFTIRARTPGDVITMRMPLLFGKGQAAQQLSDKYASGPGSGFGIEAAPPVAVVDQLIPLVLRKNAQGVLAAVTGTVQQVRSLTFGATVLPGGTGFHPRLGQLEVTLPALKQLLGKEVGTITATLAPDVRQTGEQLPAELLLFEKRVVDFASTQAGAVAAPNLAVNRIHRQLGPTVPNLPMSPGDMFHESAKLLGIVPLKDIIGAATADVRPKVTWSSNPPQATFAWTVNPDTGKGPFQPATGCTVYVAVTTVTTGGLPKTTTDGTVTNFAIAIPEPNDFLARLDFSTLAFHAETGKLPTTSFVITGAKLGKKLTFVQKLSQYLPKVGNSAPTVRVTAQAIQVNYAVALPTPVGLGLFALQNLHLQSGITLSLEGRPVTLDFAFGTRGHPFLVTVLGFSGGGYLELGMRAGDPDAGLERFVGGIEFGASVAMSFGVASGEVHVFGGVVLAKRGRDVEITGYLRIGGSVRVLGLVSVAIELTMSLTFVAPNILRGAAKLVIAIDLTFWSTSVEISCEKTFVGSDQSFADRDPFAPEAEIGYSVEKALGRVGSSFPWRTYCQAFTGE